jgi:hypothetical protein
MNNNIYSKFSKDERNVVVLCNEVMLDNPLYTLLTKNVAGGSKEDFFNPYVNSFHQNSKKRIPDLLYMKHVGVKVLDKYENVEMLLIEGKNINKIYDKNNIMDQMKQQEDVLRNEIIPKYYPQIDCKTLSIEKKICLYIHNSVKQQNINQMFVDPDVVFISTKDTTILKDTTRLIKL